jgi:hypothetical protein
MKWKLTNIGTGKGSPYTSVLLRFGSWRKKVTGWRVCRRVNSDFRELLSTLNAHGVKYLIVGAYAVSIYAQPRATKDLDILVKADAENAGALFAALCQFGAPLEGLKEAYFAESGSFFRMGREPVGVDILTAIPGVNFDEAWERRVEAIVDDPTGLHASFISREDLLGAKLASARPQDIADADAIRRATKAESPKPPK